MNPTNLENSYFSRVTTRIVPAEPKIRYFKSVQKGHMIMVHKLRFNQGKRKNGMAKALKIPLLKKDALSQRTALGRQVGPGCCMEGSEQTPSSGGEKRE